MSDRVTLVFDRDDILWLYEDLNSRRQAVPGLRKMFQAALKGKKFKEQLEKLQSDDEYMKWLMSDIYSGLYPDVSDLPNTGV